MMAESSGQTSDCAEQPHEIAGRKIAGEALTRLWREILAVDTVGMDDDFFALGGTSL